jgi:hypothetical protein
MAVEHALTCADIALGEKVTTAPMAKTGILLTDQHELVLGASTVEVAPLLRRSAFDVQAYHELTRYQNIELDAFIAIPVIQRMPTSQQVLITPTALYKRKKNLVLFS